MRQLLCLSAIECSERRIVVMRRAECRALLGVVAGVLTLELMTGAVEVRESITIRSRALWGEWSPIRLRRNEVLALRIEVLTLVAAWQRMLGVAGRSS